MSKNTPKTVAVVEESTSALTTIANAPLPAFLENMSVPDGAGLSTDAKDFLLPFLAIAQSNSPQLKRQQADKYIEGMKAGDIFNTATNEFWDGDEGIMVVPAFYQKAEVEWILRSDGGGYVDTHSADTKLLNDVQNVEMPDGRKIRKLPNGHQLVETRYHFVITDNGAAVVALTSTGLQVSRQWMTLMKNVKIGPVGAKKIAPSFSRVYKLKTIYRQNDAGDWFQFAVEEVGWVQNPDLFNEAKSFWEESTKAGVVLGRPPEAATGDSSSSSSMGNAPTTLEEEDSIPI